MTKCARCKKEMTDSFFGNCIDCIANHRKIEWINEECVCIGHLYCWIKVKNTENRWAVLDESIFYRLMKESNCSFDLVFNEEDGDIYVKDTDTKFNDYINELCGKKRKPNNPFDFRLPFNMLH